jgi:hypothetical protein
MVPIPASPMQVKVVGTRLLFSNSKLTIAMALAVTVSLLNGVVVFLFCIGKFVFDGIFHWKREGVGPI